MNKKIVFFSTAWGTRYGGMNSFNFDICRALAKLVGGKYKVICMVPRAEKGQIKEAKKEGVKLIKLRNSGLEGRFLDEDIEKVKELFPTPTKDKVLWWIGHDVRTGPIAIESAKNTGMGKIALFHHMGYPSYLPLIPINTHKPVTSQREVLKQGDIIFAIGPKLARSARDMVIGCNIKVKKLFPGLHDINGLKAPEIFSAIVFGRLNKRTDCVKQAKLAVAGFSHACSSAKYATPLGPEAALTVIGLPSGNEGDNERRELKAIAEKEAGREVQIHPWSYFEDREKLFEELKLKSVCLVASLYEGFGLVGWEAISAEVPLVISKNSGLCEFIKEHIGGKGIGCITPVEIKGTSQENYSEGDMKTISKSILKIRDDINYFKNNAIALRALLKPLFTWRNCALTFARFLGIIAEEKQEEKLCSEDYVDEVCRGVNITKEQYHEMLDNVKRSYGF